MKYTNAIRKIYDPIRIGGTHISKVAAKCKQEGYFSFVFNGTIYTIDKYGDPNDTGLKLEDFEV